MLLNQVKVRAEPRFDRHFDVFSVQIRDQLLVPANIILNKGVLDIAQKRVVVALLQKPVSHLGAVKQILGTFDIVLLGVLLIIGLGISVYTDSHVFSFRSLKKVRQIKNLH